MKSAKNNPRRKQQWPDLSSPCCAVLTTKLKAMNRFQSHTCTVLTHHSTNEFVYYSIQDQSHSTPFHSSSMTFQTFIITKSFHSASNSLTHHYISGFEESCPRRDVSQRNTATIKKCLRKTLRRDNLLAYHSNFKLEWCCTEIASYVRNNSTPIIHFSILCPLIFIDLPSSFHWCQLVSLQISSTISFNLLIQHSNIKFECSFNFQKQNVNQISMKFINFSPDFTVFPFVLLSFSLILHSFLK